MTTMRGYTTSPLTEDTITMFHIALLATIHLVVGAFVVKPQAACRSVVVSLHAQENVSIDYCTGCRWMLRSAYIAQELLTTFQDELDSVTLIPSRPPAPGGIFTVKHNGLVVWDRKEEGGFPESKELKQRIRDLIAPKKVLGHSDTADRQDGTREDCADCNENDERPTEAVPSNRKTAVDENALPPAPNAGIVYCTGCKWLLRSAWLAQELLATFEDGEIASVTLIPNRPPAKGGIFTVTLDGVILWDRAEQGRFPQPKEIKQRIRDKVAPSKDLGHSDSSQRDNPVLDTIDDDEAEEMRNFFGVM